MKVKLTLAAGFAMIACLPTEPCACPPSTTLFRIFGTVRGANAQPIAGALIAASVPITADCDAANQEELDVFPSRTDAAGKFGATLRSVFSPRNTCLRIAAYRSTKGASDSVVSVVQVNFKIDRETPDSLGLVLTLP